MIRQNYFPRSTNEQENMLKYLLNLLFNFIKSYYFKLFAMKRNKELSGKQGLFCNSIIVHILGARVEPINVRHFVLIMFLAFLGALIVLKFLYMKIGIIAIFWDTF